jgi:hypothetical protein
MNICKPLFTIIVASMLIALSPQVIADSNSSNEGSDADCRARITSTTIKIVKQEQEQEQKPEAFWQVSGDCLENITKVSLAMDDGAGYQDLDFDITQNGNKKSLSIPVVPRSGGIKGGVLIGDHVLSAGQYLLQVKSCQIGRRVMKCKIEDETFIPVIGDQDAIDTLIAIVTQIQTDPSILTRFLALFGLYN